MTRGRCDASTSVSAQVLHSGADAGAVHAAHCDRKIQDTSMWRYRPASSAVSTVLR